MATSMPFSPFRPCNSTSYLLPCMYVCICSMYNYVRVPGSTIIGLPVVQPCPHVYIDKINSLTQSINSESYLSMCGGDSKHSIFQMILVIGHPRLLIFL